MKKMIKELKKKKMVLTPQRIAVMEVLKNYGHLTAEEIYKKVKEKMPTISFATVYNILEKFAEKEEIQILNIKKEKAYYDSNPYFHHHFYCNSCGKIIDIEVECPVLKKGIVGKHRVEEVQAYFYGICQECLSKERRKNYV